MATRTSYINAINVMLSNIGQQPTASLNNSNPQVALARTVLDQVSADVQTEGWAFNRERDYPLSIQPDGTVVLPEDVVSWDLAWPTNMDVVIRKGKLYDKVTHSYDFTGKELKAEVVWLFDFEDIPNAIRNYITIRAANLFAMRTTGSAEIAKYGMAEEQQARATAIDYETQQGDYNIFMNEDGQRLFRGYTPVDTLWRF